MSDQRAEILAWTQRVASTLRRASDDDARAYAASSPNERWERVAAACRAAAVVLESSPARDRVEEAAAEDHARWGELARRIRARLDG